MDEVILFIYDKLLTSGELEKIKKKYIAMKTDEEKFAEAVRIFSVYDLKLKIKCQLKDIKESNILRNKANRIFVSKKDDVEELFVAWTLYTKSIAMAPYQSKELSISYANRSAVLFHMHKYRESLEDINRALNVKYPDHLKGKILLRKAECLQYLKNEEVEIIIKEARSWLENINISLTDKKVYEEKLISISSSNNGLISSVHDRNEIPNLPTLTHPHKNIPCASDAVSLKYSKKYGKHLVANRKINVGEILIVEKPYVSVLLPNAMYTHCAHCLQMEWTAVPCDHCVYAIYCSTKCKNEAWTQYHDIECNIHGYFINYSFQQQIRLSLRLIILAVREAGSIEKLKKYVKKINNFKDPLEKVFASDDGMFHNEKYETVYTLEPHVKERLRTDILYISLNAVLVAYYLYAKTNFLKNHPECSIKAMCMNKDLIFIGGLIMHHLHIITINSCYQYQYTEELEPKRVGCFIAGLFSMMNHSCIANVQMTTSRAGVIIHAVLPIDKGSQIEYNYGFDFMNMDHRTRKQEIMHSYYFECECIACVQPKSTLSTPIYNKELFDTNVDDKVVYLMDICHCHIFSLLEGTVKDKEKAIADLSNIIEVLVRHVPLLSDEIYDAIRVLEKYYDDKYGIKCKKSCLKLGLCV